MTPAHLTLPIRVAANGSLASAEQDTDADVQTALIAIVSYPPGYRLDNPDFGASPALFEQNGAPLQTLVDRVTETDDRIDPDAAADMVGRVQTITLDLNPDSA